MTVSPELLLTLESDLDRCACVVVDVESEGVFAWSECCWRKRREAKSRLLADVEVEVEVEVALITEVAVPLLSGPNVYECQLPNSS